MKVSDYIVHFLEEQGVRVFFGYMGGMITHLVDSISQNDKTMFIQTYHEQTASIAAEGYALESGNLGVAISTSGPGATNMITGIADAYFGSLPVIYITGQVNTYEYKYCKKIRQQGFQETDVVSIVKPITKYAKLVDEADQIKYELEKAVYIAKLGRSGPVLLDIPMNIQRAEIDPNNIPSYTDHSVLSMDEFPLTEIKNIISNAKRPMILVGGGCLSDEGIKLINDYLLNTGIPIVSSLIGKGVVDESLPNYQGMIGSYGNRCANIALANVDLLIALGTRLDTRQTGAMVDQFVKNGVIIHVDIDKDELDNNRLDNRLKIHMDVASFLKEFKKISIENNIDKWNDYLLGLKNKYNQDQEIERFVENKAPYRFIQMLNKYSAENDIFCTDVGQNQMWAAQTLELKKGQKFITSGGLAPMGFSIPVAIGISFANPLRNIYSINGDGGFHISIQSLMLISQYNLPIKVIVLNNKSLGMITQFQGLYFDNRMEGTTKEGGYLVPNIKSIGESYNLPYFQINENDLVNENLMKNIFETRNCIIEYVINGLTSVSPKLEYNRPIEQPMPILSDEELKAMMFKLE